MPSTTISRCLGVILRMLYKSINSYYMLHLLYNTVQARGIAAATGSRCKYKFVAGLFFLYTPPFLKCIYRSVNTVFNSQFIMIT